MTATVMTNEIFNNRVLNRMVDIKQDLMAHPDDLERNQKIADVLFNNIVANDRETELTDSILRDVHEYGMMSASHLFDKLDDLVMNGESTRSEDRMYRQVKAIVDNHVEATETPYVIPKEAWVTLDKDDNVVPVDSDTLNFIVDEWV